VATARLSPRRNPSLDLDLAKNHGPPQVCGADEPHSLPFVRQRRAHASAKRIAFRTRVGIAAFRNVTEPILILGRIPVLFVNGSKFVVGRAVEVTGAVEDAGQ
jgi:hypothetical protein